MFISSGEYPIYEISYTKGDRCWLDLMVFIKYQKMFNINEIHSKYNWYKSPQKPNVIHIIKLNWENKKQFNC